MTVGLRIKERRLQLGMSADTLAEKIGKNRSTVYRYENGDIESLPYDILMPIAEALHTTPAYLMGWNQDAITTAETIQDEVLSVSESLAAENVDLYNELLDLALTRDELLDVLRYANYVKSLRK